MAFVEGHGVVERHGGDLGAELDEEEGEEEGENPGGVRVDGVDAD